MNKGTETGMEVTIDYITLSKHTKEWLCLKVWTKITQSVSAVKDSPHRRWVTIQYCHLSFRLCSCVSSCYSLELTTVHIKYEQW